MSLLKMMQNPDQGVCDNTARALQRDARRREERLSPARVKELESRTVRLGELRRFECGNHRPDRSVLTQEWHEGSKELEKTLLDVQAKVNSAKETLEKPTDLGDILPGDWVEVLEGPSKGARGQFHRGTAGGRFIVLRGYYGAEFLVSFGRMRKIDSPAKLRVGDTVKVVEDDEGFYAPRCDKRGATGKIQSHSASSGKGF